MRWFLVILGLSVIPPLIAPRLAMLAAQEADTLDWDIDSMFGEPPRDTSVKAGASADTETDDIKTDARSPETPAADAEDSVANMVKQRGFTLDASYLFALGTGPGWYEAPWDPASTGDYYYQREAKMRGTTSMDAQISDVFRVKSTVYYEIPDFNLKLGDFFFDYSLYNRVFVRGGKYNLGWGISPNFSFTNLLVRIPDPVKYANDSYIFKADIPVGIGGFQVLAMTRADLVQNASLDQYDIGYGGKFNLALRWLDMDLGGFYQDGMPLRGFLSLKTTIGDTELYSEGLWAIHVDNPSHMSGSANIGLFQDFFDSSVGKFTVNAEVFYNAEKDAYWFRPESSLRDAEAAPFAEGLNGALNLYYRFKGKGKFRIFAQTRYAPSPTSVQLAPGFAFNPFPHIEIYLAIPMTLGSKSGYYYEYPLITGFNNKPLPFSISLMLTLSGNVKFGYYF